MTLYDDLMRGLAHGSGDAILSPEAELLALRREVTTLRRVVARLAEIVASEERVEPELVRSLLEGELDLTDTAAADDRSASAPSAEIPTVGDSPYRGAIPDREGEMRCRRCRRKLEADDPEMSLEDGRVCVACFQLASG